jgi:hypothetical protein
MLDSDKRWWWRAADWTGSPESTLALLVWIWQHVVIQTGSTTPAAFSYVVPLTIKNHTVPSYPALGAKKLVTSTPCAPHLTRQYVTSAATSATTLRTAPSRCSDQDATPVAGQATVIHIIRSTPCNVPPCRLLSCVLLVAKRDIGPWTTHPNHRSTTGLEDLVYAQCAWNRGTCIRIVRPFSRIMWLLNIVLLVTSGGLLCVY